MAGFEDTVRMDSRSFNHFVPGVRPVPQSHWSEVTVHSIFVKHPWLLAAVLLVLASYIWESILAQSRAPVEVVSAEAMQPSVPAGGMLQIKFVVNRREICENSIVSYWTDTKGVEVMRLPPRSRTVPKIGDNLPVFVTVPVPETTGQMCYRSSVIHRCGGGDAVVSTPPVCILVTPF